MICPACSGEGTCVNPNIDGNGLSADDFHDDPDFAEAYMEGVYDVRCAACDGGGKILRSHMRTLRQNAADRRLAAREDGDFEGYCLAGDYRFG
jgi:hypothetical protein